MRHDSYVKGEFWSVFIDVQNQWVSIRPWRHATTNYPHIVKIIIIMALQMTWVFSQMLTDGPRAKPAAVQSLWYNVGLVTLAAFHGQIDFSPTLQIIAGCGESYPPPPARRSFFRVLTREWLSDLRKVRSWHLIDCDRRLCTSCLLGFYFMDS